MYDTTSLLKSRGVWGAVIAIVAAVLDAAGVATLDDGAKNDLIDAAIKLGEVGGGLLALWGRVFATKQIAK